MRMRSIFALASIVAIAACDATSPELAGLNGPGGGGGTNGNVFPLVISPTVVQMSVGTTFQLSTNAAPEHQNQIEWTSFQPTIVTVNQSGLVKAVSAGTATIVAHYTFDTTNVATATVMASTPISGSMTTGSRSP